MTMVICRSVIAASVIVGKVTVLDVSPLNWLIVAPLRTENSCGTVEQPLQEQVSFILSPNLRDIAGPVESAVVKQLPVRLIR